MKCSINAPGKPIDKNWLAIPLAYMIKFKTKKNADLVIVEATRNMIAYSFKGNNTLKTGIVRRARIQKHRNGKLFFSVEGKKVFLSDAAMVM